MTEGALVALPAPRGGFRDTGRVEKIYEHEGTTRALVYWRRLRRYRSYELGDKSVVWRPGEEP